MKIDLKHYYDCGRCAMGTLLPEFDTDVHRIFFVACEDKTCSFKDTIVEIKISSAKDLFPFLWNTASVQSNNDFLFLSTGTWWEFHYSNMINDCEKKIISINKRIKKAHDEKKLNDLNGELKYYKNLIVSTKKMIEQKNKSMEDQKNEIIKDNENKSQD